MAKKRAERRDPVAEAVRSYTGREVLDVQVAADPVVRGTYAVRAVVKGALVKQREDFYLLRLGGRRGLQDVTWEDLEEAEFTAWPPVARL